MKCLLYELLALQAIPSCVYLCCQRACSLGQRAYFLLPCQRVHTIAYHIEQIITSEPYLRVKKAESKLYAPSIDHLLLFLLLQTF